MTCNFCGGDHDEEECPEYRVRAALLEAGNRLRDGDIPTDPVLFMLTRLAIAVDEQLRILRRRVRELEETGGGWRAPSAT